MIHKKKHPEYKYRPKKRKHLKRPTGKVTTIVSHSETNNVD